MILICVLIIITLLIIHVFVSSVKYCFKKYKLKSANINDIDLNTGDILMFKNCIKCGYGDSMVDNINRCINKRLFNAFRHYVMESKYTHVAVIIKIGDVPYICHIDGGAQMYDAMLDKYLKCKTSFCDLEHVNDRGGDIHFYKYNGTVKTLSQSEMNTFVEDCRKFIYPPSLSSLVTINVFKYGTHPDGVKACTDFAEVVLKKMNILLRDVSNQATIVDMTDIISDNNYEKKPIRIENKCYHENH